MSEPLVQIKQLTKTKAMLEKQIRDEADEIKFLTERCVKLEKKCPEAEVDLSGDRLHMEISAVLNGVGHCTFNFPMEASLLHLEEMAQATMGFNNEHVELVQVELAFEKHDSSDEGEEGRRRREQRERHRPGLMG